MEDHNLPPTTHPHASAPATQKHPHLNPKHHLARQRGGSPRSTQEADGSQGLPDRPTSHPHASALHQEETSTEKTSTRNNDAHLHEGMRTFFSSPADPSRYSKDAIPGGASGLVKICFFPAPRSSRPKKNLFKMPGAYSRFVKTKGLEPGMASLAPQSRLPQGRTKLRAGFSPTRQTHPTPGILKDEIGILKGETRGWFVARNGGIDRGEVPTPGLVT